MRAVVYHDPFHLDTPVRPSTLLRLILLATLVPLLTSCTPFWARTGDWSGYWLPLTVGLRFDPSVTGATVSYGDACQQIQTLAIGDRLTATFTREMGMAFQRVRPLSSEPPTEPLDGIVEVAIGINELELFIPRHENKTYNGKFGLGATATFFDPGGAVVYSKSLRVLVDGEVSTTKATCGVEGLEKLITNTVLQLAQGFKQHFGTSTDMQDLAGRKKGAAPPAASSARARAEEPGTAALTFRVKLSGERQNSEGFQTGERVTMEVEVTNTGSDSARDVAVILGGTSPLVQRLGDRIAVGELGPGETRRVTMGARLDPVAAPQEGELVVALEASPSGAQLPAAKTFRVPLRPGKPQGLGPPPVNVDAVPKGVRGYQRTAAVGIAIGIGAYRDPSVPAVKFAARDAEIMSKYFHAMVGVPAERIKVLKDEYALKADVAEAFEDWLPRIVRKGSVVFVYFAGRGEVEPSTGAVWLLPYEAGRGKPSQAISLRRLHTALARLPIKEAVVWLDLSLLSDGASAPASANAPIWNTGVVSANSMTLVQMVGISGHQDAHQYEQARHGLFTYYLLNGLRGAADADRNGMVVQGELCDYVRTQVMQAAKAGFHNDQQPTCVPERAPAAYAVPVARVK